jgi:hypothetical protein
VPGPRMMVDPPRFTPSQFGLLTVAELRGDGESHWQNGVTFETRCANLTASSGTTYDECIAVTGVGSPSPPPAKADNTNLRYRGATPFAVYAEFDCSTVGLDGARDQAADALERAESWQIERAFWTGQAAGTNNIAFPHLAHAGAEIVDAQQILLQTAVVTGGGPYPAAQALGVLEQRLADCHNGQGVIHVPPKALPRLEQTDSVERRGAGLQTTNGNLLAVGNGYPGTGPSGGAASDAEAWMFATGPLFVYRSQPRVLGYGAESFDRSENTIKLLAERTVVAGWDCCHFAVLVYLAA